MKKSILIILFITLLNIQCSSKKILPTKVISEERTKITNTTETMPSIQYGIIIASKQKECQGIAKQKCFLTKSLGETRWQLLYSSIEGFVYQEGYEYHLEIKKTEIKNPPADSSNSKYELVRVISKEKKDSDIRMEVEKPTFDSTWNVRLLNGKTLQGFISFRNNGTAKTNIGCNTMAGIKFNVNTSAKTIQFNTERVASTMMACAENHDMELQKTLEKATHFEELSKRKLLLKENNITLLELSR